MNTKIFLSRYQFQQMKPVSIHFRQIDQIQKIRENLVPQRIVYKTDIFKKYLKKEK